MSRIGKLPITIPADVDINWTGSEVSVKGKFGTLETAIPDTVMIQQDENQIIELIQKKHHNQKILILAPKIKARKGHYSDLFQNLIKKGFIKVKINNEIINLDQELKLDRYKTHNIDVVIDKFTISKQSKERLKKSIKVALEESNGSIIIQQINSKKQTYYSKYLTCPTTGISYENPEPNSFSFNSPKGYCQNCKGLALRFLL